MSVVSIHGRDAGAFAKSVLHRLLENGDVAGRDGEGRTVLQLSIDDWLLEELCAFDAEAAELEDADGELEPDQEIDGPATVIDVTPPRRISRRTRVAKVVAGGLLLAIAALGESHAGEVPVVAPLPMLAAQAPAQCCRICRKDKACGNGCISAAKQCRVNAGCACASPSGASEVR